MILFLSEICRLILGFLEDEKFAQTYQVFLNECAYLQECRIYIENGLEFSKKIHGKDLRQFLTTNSEIKEFISTHSQTVKKFTIDSSCQTEPINFINTTEQTEPEQKKTKPKPSDLFKKRKTGCFKHKAPIINTTQSPKTAPIKQSDDLDLDFFIENLCQNDFAQRLAESINELNAKKTIDCSLNETKTAELVIEQMETEIFEKNVVSENDAAINFNLTQLDFDDKFFIGNEDISILAEHFSEPAFETLFELISSNESKPCNNPMQQPTEPIKPTDDNLNIHHCNNFKQTEGFNCIDSNKQIENKADFASNYYTTERYSYDNNEPDSNQKEIEPEINEMKSKYEKELDLQEVKINSLEKSISDLEQNNSPKEERSDFVQIFPKDSTIISTESFVNQNSLSDCVHRRFDYNIQEVVYKTVCELNKSLETADIVPDEASSNVNDQINLTKDELEKSISDLKQDNSSEEERQKNYVATYSPTERYYYDKKDLVNGKDFTFEAEYMTCSNKEETDSNNDQIKPDTDSNELDSKVDKNNSLEESSSDLEQDNSSKEEKQQNYVANYSPTERYYYVKDRTIASTESLLNQNSLNDCFHHPTDEIESKYEKKIDLKDAIINSSDLEQDNSPKEERNDFVPIFPKDSTIISTESYVNQNSLFDCVNRPLNDFNSNIQEVVYKKASETDKTISELNKSQNADNIVNDLEDNEEYSDQQQKEVIFYIETDETTNKTQDSPVNCKPTEGINCFDSNTSPTERYYYNNNELETDEIISSIHKQDSDNEPETDGIEPDKDEKAFILGVESNLNQKGEEASLNESLKEHTLVKEQVCLQENQNLSIDQTEDHEVTIDISSPLKEEKPEKYINEVKRYEQPVCSINGQSFIIIGKYPEVLSFEKKLKSIIKTTNDSKQIEPVVSLDQEEITNSALNTSSSNSYSIPPTPFLKQSQQTNEEDLLSDYSDPELNLSTNAMPYSPQPPKTPPKPIQSNENSLSCSKKIFKKSVSFQCSFKDCFPSYTKTEISEIKPIETIKEEDKLEPGEIEDDSNEVEQINKENNITSTPTKTKQEEILSLSLSYSSTSTAQNTPIKALNSSDNNKPNIKETNEKIKNKSNELNIDEILKLVKPTSFITNEPARKEPTFKKDFTKQSTESILRQSSSSIVFRPDSSKAKENRNYNDYKDRRDYKSSSNRKNDSSRSSDYKRKRDHFDDFMKDDYESGNKKQYDDSKRNDRSKYDRYTSDTSYNNKRFNSDRNNKYSEWK